MSGEMQEIAESVGCALGEAVPSVLDALIKAFGEASAEEQAALLNALARSVTGGETWAFQADWIDEKLDNVGRAVFSKIGGETKRSCGWHGEVHLAMRRQGLTQKTLAGRLSARESWVSHILLDDSNPTLATMERFARALGVPTTFEVSTRLGPARHGDKRFEGGLERGSGGSSRPENGALSSE